MTVRITILGAVALGLAAAAPVAAQPPAQPLLHQVQAQDYSDAKLQSFLRSSLNLREITERWNERMMTAEDMDEAMEMREQGMAEMVAAVEEEGLTVEEYSQIGEAVEADPELHGRVMALAAEMDELQVE